MTGFKKPARKPPPKGRSVSPTLRSTSGAGFNFEDLIAAWQLVKTLAGEKLPGVGGAATKLQAQVSTLGWRIDDLLLTGEHDGVSRRLAISAKGNQQVSASSLPSDFVERAWEQWRDGEGPFDPKTDGLALVTIGSNPEFNEAWREVKNACGENDKVLTLSRIRATPRQSRVFDSVQMPGGALKGSDDETIALIRCLHVLPTDLQLAYSETENQAIAQCRHLLASGKPGEANDLWQRLITAATDVRLHKGTVTIHGLLSQLRGKFELLQHPDYARDWKTLASITADHRVRIQTELPSGYSIPRLADKATLQKAVAENAVTVVFGESGTGKSALLKSVLDSDFPSFNQVWLGPDELQTALSAARRSSLPLGHELAEILNSTVRAANVLVLDSAERIEPTEFVVVRKMLQSIAPSGPDAQAGAWRVVIVTQPQGWDEESILAGQRAQLVEPKPLSIGEARIALGRSATLSWLTGHEDTVAALTNLRTMSWVIKAGAALGTNASGLASHTAIADRIWKYWTKDRPDVQAMMMRLAHREASFERSFALTDLVPADAVIFAQRPSELPLRLNERTNRIEFEHDLAADWARFQYLKQISSDIAQWAALAANPLWTNALRMLGQFLLRQPSSSGTAWDVAFRTASDFQNTLAGDVVLDALYLDPEAERFLTERIDMLLEGNASNLSRLLTRFHHTATVPTVGSQPRASTIALYLEVKFRSIIFARWPPLLRFLIAQRERLKGLVSTSLAQVIETWLTKAPREVQPNVPMPFRRELAELALAMARTVQVEKGHGVAYLMQETSLYTAPLTGAADLPEEVGNWALELAGRREVDGEVARRISDALRRQAEERAERLKTDETYRAQEDRKRRIPRFIGSFNERLPPWPLGASHAVDMDFRNACLDAGALRPLMEARPEVAAEVLLALIIEHRPEGGRDRNEVDLGLEFPRDAYPTAFWKSAFFPFLQSAPVEALGAIIKLVNFCTERWVAVRSHGGQREIPSVTLQLDGTEWSLPGWRDVFNWVQSNGPMNNGNLYCALDALERWLITRLEAGEDLSEDIDRLLHEGNSAAFVSVLVNIAKYQPTLLAGPLAPLLTFPALFFWDSYRVKHINYNFIGWSWLRAGEGVFEFARDWTLAPHRQLKLVDVAIDLMIRDEEVARRLQALIPTWTLPEDTKASLEARLLYASLDRANYPVVVDPTTGEDSRQLVYPETLTAAVRAWQSAQNESLEHLMLSDRCRDRLSSGQELTPREAEYLFGFVQNGGAETDDDGRARCVVAAAATLLVLANDWLSAHPAARVRSNDIVRATVADIPTNVSAVRGCRFRRTSNDLAFAAHATMHLWLEDRSNLEREHDLVRLLTNGDLQVARVIMDLAVARREALGDAWWRLLQLGVLWSGLVLLMPRHEDEEAVATVWGVWLARLRRFRLSGEAATFGALDFKRVAAVVGRMRFDREMRNYLAGNEGWRGEPERQIGDLLDVQFLDGLFAWLLTGDGTGDRDLDRELTLRVWDYDATRARQHAKTERYGEYDLPSQDLGYNVLMKLAALAAAAPPDQQRAIWEPVLSHGPAAHVALQHFVSGVFLRVEKIDDVAAFEQLWRSMSGYAVAADWSQSGLWFYGERLICDILGFGNESALARLPAGAALRMRELYERWAASHLNRDEECIARFAQFLTTEFGTPLLLDGLHWIASMLGATKAFGHWYRDGTGQALVHLAASALSSHGDELARDSVARRALIDIVAALAEKSVPGALALQDRVRLVR
ncbi:P-loop NTPase family protein [Rhizobium bangladeshense]|uniref:ATP-binding protein n=1 Tax=Rhizobium bangladeshense TaxID=1138189 RepID=UPI001C83029E|nr:ATP-binding protein [Rhizobium bangladeshense]